jgi:hypothetical protein
MIRQGAELICYSWSIIPNYQYVIFRGNENPFVEADEDQSFFFVSSQYLMPSANTTAAVAQI